MSVNLLLSYAFHAKTDLTAVRRNLVCGQLMIDSGAFSAWSQGSHIDLDSYAEYLHQWRHCWDHAITLDVIGNPTATRANTHHLHARGLPVIPVFTRGDTLADFDAMVRDHSYVCVGGLVGLPLKAQRDRATMLQRRAQHAGGGIHTLGIGSMPALREARPYSADASSVSSNFLYGKIAYFTGQAIRIVPITDRAKLTRDWHHIRAHGIDLALLARTRRMPNQQQGSGALMRAMSMAYACADETLKQEVPTPAPHPLSSGGPHLYNSVSTKEQAYNVAECDFALHSKQAPPVWAGYERLHTCQTAKGTAHDSTTP